MISVLAAWMSLQQLCQWDPLNMSWERERDRTSRPRDKHPTNWNHMTGKSKSRIGQTNQRNTSGVGHILSIWPPNPHTTRRGPQGTKTTATPSYARLWASTKPPRMKSTCKKFAGNTWERDKHEPRLETLTTGTIRNDWVPGGKTTKNQWNAQAINPCKDKIEALSQVRSKP